VQLDGQRVETLTELEFELLCYLYEQHGRICSKHELIENIYHQQYNYRQDRYLDQMLQALISRLREKIEPDRQHPSCVVTVRGEGYRFAGPASDK
jgi:DNA-binding response OmpR family regulator